jgi:predicted  nucleic acid-binding Zn-ribbon protein
MIENLMCDIEAKIRAEKISDSGKSELLQLLGKLKAELATLEETSDATREKLKSLKSPVEELRSSVEDFEQSHPKLVQTVNSISSALSNLGI